MFPIALDVARLETALIGNGSAAARRLGGLDDAGAGRVTVFADAPSAALRDAAGDRLVERLPDAADLARFRIVLIAGLGDADTARLASLARATGALVNVEDRPAWCDFHVQSVIRRGDLTVGISTNGRAPGLAKRLRRHLEGLIAPVWAGRLEELANRREGWRGDGADLHTVMRRTDAVIEKGRWLE